jgi:hypothetical protein
MANLLGLNARVTSSLLLGALLAWGIPFGATPRKDAYLGVIERLSGDPVWVRVPFKRDQDGDWSPTLVQEKPRDHEDLNAAAAALPARITWRICRDGRSLGTIVSARRPIERRSQRGTQALRSAPAAVGAAPNDERYRIIMTEQAAARPFVISTLPDACAAALSARRAGDDAVARVTRLVLAQRNLHTGKTNRLMDARGWQAGDWTIVDLTLEEDGAWLAVVAFAREDDIRYTVQGARVVDWISADGDAVPDVVLWIDGLNRSGYLLVYGKFEKQAAFDWSYK